jgi:hypothetical protein
MKFILFEGLLAELSGAQLLEGAHFGVFLHFHGGKSSIGFVARLFLMN